MKIPGMSGFFVAAVSPFTPDNRLNEEALQALMRRCITQGAAGFLIGGSSAECLLLTHEERARSFAAAGALRGQAKLMAGISAFGTDEAIAYARQARDAGFHALISTPPFFYRFGMEQIAAYYRDIRLAVDLPLLIYNFPGNTGVTLDTGHPAIRALLRDGAIAGVKHTSPDLYQLERMRDLNPDLLLYGGYDEVYTGARLLGADGAIGSTFNFSLPLFTRIEAALREKNLGEAQALQARANRIMQALVVCGLFPSIKHILGKQGLAVGACRRPFAPLTPAQRSQVERAVADNL
ncbi:MAG: dihydrodipicolinate synthase family protein [Oscillospiraceae bacterium]|jgi:N-acetylneuraminate lyase|nr:dihydrodipicolinate synthase family protein [Oscillospiraceae bacterium]